MSFADQLDPVGNLLVIRDDELDRELASGLVMPESAKTVVETGTIVKVGPEAHPEYRPGRRLVFRPHAGIPLCLEEDVKGVSALRILSPGDVKCFLDEAEVA